MIVMALTLTFRYRKGSSRLKFLLVSCVVTYLIAPIHLTLPECSALDMKARSVASFPVYEIMAEQTDTNASKANDPFTLENIVCFVHRSKSTDANNMKPRGATNTSSSRA